MNKLEKAEKKYLKDTEEKIGRKLTIKEKIFWVNGFWKGMLYQLKIRKRELK